MNTISGQTIKCKNPSNCWVILVEDDPMLSLVMSMQLQSAGIKFCSAKDGIEALELIKSHRPRLLLLDITMPGLNGFELIEVILSDPALEELRTMSVIVHSSLDLNRADEMRLTMNGRTEFISKSMATQELVTVVSKFHSEN